MVVVAPGPTVGGEALADEEKVGAATPAGTTKRVMLCAGSDVEKLLPLKVISLRRLMELAAVNCRGSARPALEKLPRLTVTGVGPERYLEMTTMVRAPSEERWAAKAATFAGLGPDARTLGWTKRGLWRA